MTQLGITVAIAAGGFLLSLAGSMFIAGFRWGSVKVRLEIMEKQMPSLATKDQLSGIKEDMAEIKGMFRMVPRDGSSGREGM